MSASKNPSHYSILFHQLARLTPAQLPLEVPFETRKDAEKTRRQWYYFVYALRLANHPLYENADRLETTLRGSILRFGLRNANLLQPLAQALSTRLSTAQPTAAEADQPPTTQDVTEGLYESILNPKIG